MKKEASYIPNKMIVTEAKNLGPKTKGLSLVFADKTLAKEFTFESGQFVLLSLPGYGEGTFAITSAPSELPRIDLAIHSVGNLTQALNRLKKDDFVWLRGPYGQGFSWTKLRDKHLVFVAGGIGLAPLRSLIKTIELDKFPLASLTLFVGAKEPSAVIYKDDLKKLSKNHDVYISVNEADSDWKGYVGNITTLLTKANLYNDGVAILCGPQDMFAAAVKKLTSAGLESKNIYVMLERRLKCGIGKCQHCTCGDKYVCLDGPIFNWLEIEDNFEALTK